MFKCDYLRGQLQSGEGCNTVLVHDFDKDTASHLLDFDTWHLSISI